MNDNSFVTTVAAIAIVMAQEVTRGILEENIPGLDRWKRYSTISAWSVAFCCSRQAIKPDKLDRAETYARLKSHEVFGTVLLGVNFVGTSEDYLNAEVL